MSQSKKIGFYCGEEKLTIIELEKNTSVQVVSALLGAKGDTNSPFSSGLTEEIQITALLQKILKDYGIKSSDFCVSLPMKDIILRSFSIPWVNPRELQNVIKFEAKKYVPFEIQDISFVTSTFPFTENQVKRIRVIFFAVRKEVLARYERIFQQQNVKVLFCGPCQVSLVRALLYKKEIKLTDRFVFLYLDKSSSYICFVDRGIPQFVREFQITTSGASGQTNDSIESLNAKILNEVGISFDFYARQFNGERMEQMIVSSFFDLQELLDTMAGEFKVKIKKFSPLVTTVGTDQINHIDAVYALGAGVDVPAHSLSAFNFLAEKSSDSEIKKIFDLVVNEYKDILLTLFVSAIFLVGVFFYFQTELNNMQKKYDGLAHQQGIFLGTPVDTIQSQTQDYTDKLSNYKSIPVKSDAALILLKAASLLPQGAWLRNVEIKYEGSDLKSIHATIDLEGYVFKDDISEQITAVYGIVSSFKSDKVLSGIFSNVKLGPLTRNKVNDRDVTSFIINGS
ncbi:MAG: pilus assembly protein PilM [Candidatus Omnitrophica bacterium]|nr:pilus assembly protein PilM [Candidatus Omnitrophota bacterium]